MNLINKCPKCKVYYLNMKFEYISGRIALVSKCMCGYNSYTQDYDKINSTLYDHKLITTSHMIRGNFD